MGPGRWGSADRWLGIPVRWDEISGARVIVETDLEDFKVTPSQGSHFFQNLTSFQVGYLTVNAGEGQSRLDWDWFDAATGSGGGRVRPPHPPGPALDDSDRWALPPRCRAEADQPSGEQKLQSS